MPKTMTTPNLEVCDSAPRNGASLAESVFRPYNMQEAFMRIGFDDKWALVSMEMEERPEVPSPWQSWWVIGPEGEVLGKLRAAFSTEELSLLFD